MNARRPSRADELAEQLRRRHDGALIRWMAGPPPWHRPILVGTPYLTVSEAGERTGMAKEVLEALIAAGSLLAGPLPVPPRTDRVFRRCSHRLAGEPVAMSRERSSPAR